MRNVTTNAHNSLMLDMPITAAAAIDFGVKTEEDYRVLQKSVRAGATVEELDKALGNGEDISALVKKYTDIDVKFKTVYDNM